MAYSELIKDISRIRDYMREFFVYGFKSRDEVGSKSARSYDNERRRIESWLGEYMSFRQDGNGKNVFISVDERSVSLNPLYKAWKAKSFTKNDITLHFWLLDVLCEDKTLSLTDILSVFDSDYLPLFPEAEPIDESTLRKKLKEYVKLGLITAEKQGKQLAYRLPANIVDLRSWADVVAFFAETDPLGVVGSYIQDKSAFPSDYFCFKHSYLLFAPDSGICLDLLTAIGEHRCVELEFAGNKRRIAFPFKIYISTQSGRQYAVACNMHRRIQFFRLDSIRKVKLLESVADYTSYQKIYEKYRNNLWGVSAGDNEQLQHIEMTLRVETDERYIIGRLEREKRCGYVEQIDDTHWRFAADVYDAGEMLPWIRTFIGRIETLTCSDKSVEVRFASDLVAMSDIYGYVGGDGNVV